MKNIISGQTFNGEMPIDELEKRKKQAERHYVLFLEALGYDTIEDANMQDTARRVVKMYTQEICKGTYQKEPQLTIFPNRAEYDGIVFQGNIEVKSICSHHCAFIEGYAHIAYIPNDVVIGLSKLNRVVDWFARRPQLQEQLTMQIHNYLNDKLVGNKGIAVMIEAKHSCVSMRGIEHKDSRMTTSKLSGAFLDNQDKSREEFYNMINKLK